MRGHSDFLAKLAQCGILRRFAAMPAASGNAPTGRVAELHQDHLAVGRESERVRPERARAADEPCRFQQFVRGGQAHTKQRIDPIHRQTVLQL